MPPLRPVYLLLALLHSAAAVHKDDDYEPYHALVPAAPAEGRSSQIGSEVLTTRSGLGWATHTHLPLTSSVEEQVYAVAEAANHQPGAVHGLRHYYDCDCEAYDTLAAADLRASDGLVRTAAAQD